MKSNILIVEDHELTRFGLKTAFEGCEYIENIFESDSAEACLNIIKENIRGGQQQISEIISGVAYIEEQDRYYVAPPKNKNKF